MIFSRQLYLFVGFILTQAHVESVDLAWWLRRSEYKVYSQNGEDGLLAALISCLEATTGKLMSHYFVEFGVQDGSECNTKHLMQSGGCNCYH